MLRTKSIGFKVSQEEYAQLETAAQASGRTLGEWCREAILRGGSASDAERRDPALAEIVGVRLLLVNVLRPLAAGEKLAPEAFDKMLDQISEVKHELSASATESHSEAWTCILSVIHSWAGVPLVVRVAVARKPLGLVSTV